jgi:type III pantothenate kinase
MTLLLEIGNSTFKLAEARGDGFWVQRFDHEEACLQDLARRSGSVRVARVAPARGERLMRAHAARMVELTHAHFAAFLDGAYDAPETLGLDRVLHLRGLRDDGIVVSCGTAITVDARLRGAPRFGAILPGLLLATRALHARLPALPEIALRRVPAFPARTTEDSLANGIIAGMAGAVQRIAEALAPTPLPIIVTGGDAEVLAPLLRGQVRVEPELLFCGMVAAQPDG